HYLAFPPARPGRGDLRVGTLGGVQQAVCQGPVTRVVHHQGACGGDGPQRPAVPDLDVVDAERLGFSLTGDTPAGRRLHEGEVEAGQHRAAVVAAEAVAGLGLRQVDARRGVAAAQRRGGQVVVRVDQAVGEVPERGHDQVVEQAALAGVEGGPTTVDPGQEAGLVPGDDG